MYMPPFSLSNVARLEVWYWARVIVSTLVSNTSGVFLTPTISTLLKDKVSFSVWLYAVLHNNNATNIKAVFFNCCFNNAAKKQREKHSDALLIFSSSCSPQALIHLL